VTRRSVAVECAGEREHRTQREQAPEPGASKATGARPPNPASKNRDRGGSRTGSSCRAVHARLRRKNNLDPAQQNPGESALRQPSRRPVFLRPVLFPVVAVVRRGSGSRRGCLASLTTGTGTERQRGYGRQQQGDAKHSHLVERISITDVGNGSNPGTGWNPPLSLTRIPRRMQPICQGNFRSGPDHSTISTSVPSSTSPKSWRTSSFFIRTQPWLVGWPMVSSWFVPWM